MTKSLSKLARFEFVFTAAAEFGLVEESKWEVFEEEAVELGEIEERGGKGVTKLGPRCWLE